CVDSTDDPEAAGDIEAFRVRVADNVERSGRPPAGNVGDVVEEPSADAMVPERRLDEHGVQLRAAVRAWQDGGKADEDALAFCDEALACRNLLDRERNRVRICKKSVTIAAVGERGAPLQRFEPRALGLSCRADQEVRHSGTP